MKKAHQLPDGYCFPTPPGRIDWTLEQTPFLPDVAAVYLNEILRWRDDVAAAIDERDPSIDHVEHLTPRARARLSLLLSSGWNHAATDWAERSGYGLLPFPMTARVSNLGDPMQLVLEVLRWRAAVVNYLTDVWDAPGKRELKMGECAAIGMFIRPIRLEGRCVYCLTEYGPSRIDPIDHDCMMARLAHVL